MNPERLRFVFINGKGSAGKDTQADVLCEKTKGAVRISTGDIYRGARTPDGPFGQFHYLLEPYIDSVDKGGYFPDEIMLEIVAKVIEKEIEQGHINFIFTGFPRTVEQLMGVDRMLKEMGREYDLESAFIYLAVLDQQSRGRAKKRRDEAEREKAAIRADDMPDVVERRLNVFDQKTRPMLRKLIAEERLCIVRANREIDEVTDSLMLMLKIKQ